MTLISDEQWKPLARALTDEIGPTDPAWRQAFESVPRHAFVPSYWSSGPEREEVTSADPRWLKGVYSDDPLTVQLKRHPDHPGGKWPTSSSSRPSLMLSMLEALDVRAGTRVLEIGTGTGYNAALLASRLGDAQVVSVDIDPELVANARERLARIGSRPTLATVDGREGYPDAAPYDRVIATHSVEQVPYAWVAQTRPGGVILVDVRSVGATRVGHIARLTVHADGTATGDFRHPEAGFFMPTRLDLDRPNLRFGLSSRDLRDAKERGSEVGGHVLKEPGLALALWGRVPEISVSAGDEAEISTPDGSWATAPDGHGEVQVAGERDLWAVVEEVYAWWESAGRPGVRDFTVTVTPEGTSLGLSD